MIYLVYQDDNEWRISRSDGRSSFISRSYQSKAEAVRIAETALVEYEVYRLMVRRPLKARVTN